MPGSRGGSFCGPLGGLGIFCLGGRGRGKAERMRWLGATGAVVLALWAAGVGWAYDAGAPGMPRLPVVGEEGQVETDRVIFGPVRVN